METRDGEQLQAKPPDGEADVSTPSPAGNADGLTCAAASVLLFDERGVLLVLRGEGGPNGGLWSAPGGHVEAGECTEQAARRELAEETGITTGALLEIGVHTLQSVTSRTGAGPRNYRIAVFAGTAPAGSTPVAATDAARARFVPLNEVAGLARTERLDEIIGLSVRRLARR